MHFSSCFCLLLSSTHTESVHQLKRDLYISRPLVLCCIFTFCTIIVPQLLQDTLRNPTVRHFMDTHLEGVNFTTQDILNLLYTGPEEWREPGMPSFDWRNVFNIADQLLRMFNQYGEVRNTRQSSHVEQDRSFSCLPLSQFSKHSRNDVLRLCR